MPMRDILLPEFDQEMANTRKVLERVPYDRFTWKPHPKSFSMGDLAIHVATMPGWTSDTVEKDSLDYAPVGGPPYTPPTVTSSQELLDLFDKNTAAARSALTEVSDEGLGQPWTLLAGGQTIFTLPRVAVLRSMIMNHNVHHRAQLCVYLRLNDIPVPGMYGPSADEQ